MKRDIFETYVERVSARFDIPREFDGIGAEARNAFRAKHGDLKGTLLLGGGTQEATFGGSRVCQEG